MPNAHYFITPLIYLLITFRLALLSLAVAGDDAHARLRALRGARHAARAGRLMLHTLMPGVVAFAVAAHTYLFVSPPLFDTTFTTRRWSCCLRRYA